jgi:hypothetical protein
MAIIACLTVAGCCIVHYFGPGSDGFVLGTCRAQHITLLNIKPWW